MRTLAGNTFRLATSLMLGWLSACSQTPNYAPVQTVNQALTPHDVQGTDTRAAASGHAAPRKDQPLTLSSRQNPKITVPAATVPPHKSESVHRIAPKASQNREVGSLPAKSPPSIIAAAKRPDMKSTAHNVKSRSELRAGNKVSPVSENKVFDPKKARSDQSKKSAIFSNPAIIASQTLSAADQKAGEKVLITSKKQPVEKSVISIDNKKMLKLNFEWPMHGKMTRNFAQTDHKGIDISGKIGESVKAAESGTAVYCGQGLKGFGKLIVIKHNETFLSAYANNSKIYISEGQRIKKGQTIGQVDASGFKKTSLHFEIRKNGKPINPLSLLTNH